MRSAVASDQEAAIARESVIRTGAGRRQAALDDYLANASPRGLDRGFADGVGDVPQTEALYGRRLEGEPNRVVDQGIATQQPQVSAPEQSVNPINDAVNQRRLNRNQLLGGIAGAGLGLAGINAIRQEQAQREEEQELLASLGYR